MTRKALVRAAAALAALASTAWPAAAQSQSKFEGALGFAYPMLSQQTYMDENFVYRLRAGIRLAPKFWLQGVYDLQNSETRIPNSPTQGDADMTLWGLDGLFELAGEPQMQLIGLLGVGLGEINVDGVDTTGTGLSEDTDIDLWWEAGVGAQFTLGPRFRLRLLLAMRQLQPSEPSVVLAEDEIMYVPSADLVFRF